MPRIVPELSMPPQDFLRWRHAHGYSQTQLARRLGVHYRTIGKWERGESHIPPFMSLALWAIARQDEEAKEEQTA
jgi:transcriptional regulator with XRE-family HTH domain